MNKATLLSVILDSPCFFPLSNHFITTVNKAKTALALELKLYQKLIFKNTNTHKKTKYWQRVRQVKGWIQALQLALEYFSLNEPHHDSTPKSAVLFLHKLFGFYTLCTEVSLQFLYSNNTDYKFPEGSLWVQQLGLPLWPFSYMASLLEQTYYMAIAVGIISCTSRFYAITRTIMEDIILLYNQLVGLTFQKEGETSPDQLLSIDPSFCPREASLLNGLPSCLVGPQRKLGIKGYGALYPGWSFRTSKKMKKERELLSFLEGEDVGGNVRIATCLIY